MKEKIKDYANKYKYFIIPIFVLILLLICFNVYENHKENVKQPEMKTVQSTTPAEIQRFFPKMTNSDAKDVSRRIDVAQRNQAPTHEYFAKDQESADKTATSYAKSDHADYVVKTTESVPVIDSCNSEDKSDSNPKVIQNKYYAISMEKKHAISVGAAAVDNKAYATVSYRNRKTTVTAMYDPNSKNVGVAASYEIAKW